MNSHFLDLLEQETTALADRLDKGLPTDKEGIVDVLKLLTAIHRAADLVPRYARDLVKAALVAGVPQPDLVQLPYHETQVRRLAREAGVDPMPTGRRPSRRTEVTA